ncbi:MAG TPA: polysaccharide biosynthesis tyrosine autokinase, partial [Planctomycetota bacterium]|nr:polysaccharide biosynthesis tyrosine autokinase [Planctomycetota bacterium]
LKDKHPRAVEVRNELARVDAQIKDSVQGTLHSFDKTLEAIREEEKKIAAEKARIEEDMGGARRSLTEYKRLDAELATSKELYNSYLKKHSEARATSTSGQAGVRVVDPATVPAEPYKKPNWLLSLGFVLGLVLAAAAVSLAEIFDDRLASPEEVELFLGLSVLGEIPRPTNDRQELLVDEELDAPAFEAYRSLRAQLVTRLEEVNRGKIILVTSSEAGEGKSSVAANLARVLAMEDQKVLLFDAELRWPCMKALLADPRGRGLEELLRGEVALLEAVQRSCIPGVDVIGADTGLLRAPEMAGSLRFQAALREAREHYDFVVIDSAPVNLVSDTALVARRTDATLLVIRHQQTSRAAALAARKRLVDLGAPLMGAVVLGTTVPENFFGYQNRRDPDQEAQVIEKEGDNLVGVV